MKRWLIRTLRPSTADLRALLAERLPAPVKPGGIHAAQLDVACAQLDLRDAQYRMASMAHR